MCKVLMLKNFKNKSFLIIFFLFIVAMLLQYIEFFNSFFLTNIISGRFPLSPLTILILIFFIDWLILKFIKSQKNIQVDAYIKKSVVGLSLYSMLVIVGIGLVLLIRLLFFKSNPDFKVEALFDIKAKDLYWFFIFLFLFITYFIFSIFIYMKIDRLNLSVRFRLGIVFLIVSLFSIFALFFISLLLLIPVVLSFLIYLFILDIYIDQKTLNSTWIFTWMIIIAGFTSLIVFSAYSDYVRNNDLTKVKSLIYGRDYDFEQKIKNLSEAKDSPKDGEYYMETLNPDSVEFLDKLNSGFYTIDNNLFFNPVYGDYIKLDSVLNKEKYYIKYFYCLKSMPNFDSKNIKPDYIVVYDGNVLFNNSGLTTVPVPEKIDSSKNITEYIVDGFSYIRYVQDKKTIVYKINKIPGILRPLSLFSLFFVMIGLLFFIISIINSRFKFLPDIIELSFSGVKTLKDRIQFSIIGLLIISFFVLGIITFHYFHNFFEVHQKEKANLYSSIISSGFYQPNIDVDSMFVLDKLLSLERSKNINFYFYDRLGKLVIDKRRRKTGHADIPLRILDFNKFNFSNGIGFYEINNYLLSAVPVSLNNSGKGFIAGYFFNSNSAVIAASDILSNFLNVYVLLFLLSGAIAIALANSISKPIEILGEKMEILSLNENNELLKWNKNDEIGKLISIYNLTVKKLKESAKIITKIERDSAWRDMAKQVAHEIKNPLTPLKLNIQYLQSFVSREPERAGEMIRQLAPGLIEQINNLDKIATEFSDFAKMPTARNEKVNLNEIVKAVHDFFRKREDLEIQLYVPINDVIVFADKNHIVSILNNIIKNAIQAIPTERKGKITIDLYKEKDNSIIKITDNGIGISDEMKTKVFSPNFTTKSSGTGLGLAISSNMIQAFNGKIYFVTKINVGTSFYVEIPLMRIKENYNGQKRVSLDD